MSLFQVACPGGDDLFLAVQRYIEDELDIDHLGSGQHILMDGVVFQHAGVGIRAGNGLVAVVFVDGLLGADARQDALAAAGEAGEEVWLNKASVTSRSHSAASLLTLKSAPEGSTPMWMN